MSEKENEIHGSELPPDAPAEMPPPPLVRPPFWMIAAGLVAVVLSWVPLALSARGRSGRSSEPRDRKSVV